MELNGITGAIVDCAYRVHKDLGPGMFESVYENILAHELQNRGLKIERQKIIPISYKGLELPRAFKLDLLVEEKVIVEIKSVELISNIHKKQLLTYLRLTNIKVGLLINFGESLIKDGITRIIN